MGVMDSFEAPRIPTGDGLSSVQFTADYRHHMVILDSSLSGVVKRAFRASIKWAKEK